MYVKPKPMLSMPPLSLAVLPQLSWEMFTER